MGTTNYGIQKLSFDYNQDATGVLFNNIGYKIIPVGLYEGFTLTKLSDILISISKGVCYIQDVISEVGVRVETAQAQNLTVSNSTPYVVFRMEWTDTTNCYMDMIAVTFADIQDNDIIVGRCLYDDAGVIMLSAFDYTRRQEFYTSKLKVQSQYIKVLSTEPTSNQFQVTSGVLNSSKGNLIILGGTYPVGGVSSTTNGRIDIIYIDENGLVKVQEGVDSSSPVAVRYGNRKVIAEIRRGASRNTIRGSEIFQVSSSYDVPPVTSDQLIVDTNSLFASANVEDALQELAGENFTFKGNKTLEGATVLKAVSGSVAETAQGVAGSNIQNLKKADGTIVQYVDQNGKLVNTVRNELAILDVYSVFTTDRVEEALNQLSGENMTIKGVKTFELSPIVPTPTVASHPATKQYVDDRSTVAFLNNIVHPIGEAYTQYPGYPDPNALYPGTTWAKKTGWAGYFFRNEGGNAAAFGDSQGNAIKQHRHEYYTTRARDNSTRNAQTIGWGNPDTGKGPFTVGMGGVVDSDVATETRPDNITTILWIRVS